MSWEGPWAAGGSLSCTGGMQSSDPWLDPSRCRGPGHWGFWMMVPSSLRLVPHQGAFPREGNL